MTKINTKTKKQRVLEALQTGNTLTGLNLSHYAGTLHVSQIISKLKQEGHNIVTEEKRDLDGAIYAVYTLIPSEQPKTARQATFGFVR